METDMNKNTIQGDWEKIKGKAKQQWAKLGDTDFDLYAKGKVQEFSGSIQKAYGKTQDEADKEIKKFEESCGCSSADNKAA